MCVCVRERERRIFSREAKGQFSSKHNTTCDKEKKSARSKKVSSSSEGGENGVSIPTFAPTEREVARIFPSFFRRSFSLFRSTGANGPVDRGARGEGVIGSLGSRTPPFVGAKGKKGDHSSK